jgi:CheY-like chemotaxis protein
MSVLVVDESADCREVLCTLLQRRGVRTLEASGARQGLDLMRRHNPDVVVLDMDTEAADDASVRQAYDDQSRLEDSAMVLLGVVHRDDVDRVGHGVRKPYHYAPLIRTIEQLLGR